VTRGTSSRAARPGVALDSRAIDGWTNRTAGSRGAGHPMEQEAHKEATEEQKGLSSEDGDEEGTQLGGDQQQ
jgi:hypothetical protein